MFLYSNPQENATDEFMPASPAVPSIPSLTWMVYEMVSDRIPAVL